jgi:hypothetical protein
VTQCDCDSRASLFVNVSLMTTSGATGGSRAAKKNAARRKRKKLEAPRPRAGGGDDAVVACGATVRARSVEETNEEEEEEEEEEDNNAPVVARTGAYGSYGSTSGRMSIEDDEWATAQRTWDALATVLLPRFAKEKIWAPFVYDERAGERMKLAGFEKVVHKRADFFARVRDGPFVRSLSAVVDNPPYTGKGMKERVLRALVEAEVPFCLLLPLGVLHGAMVREVLDEKEVQVIIPRKCYVFKVGGAEVPFKYLCWLCYRMKLEKDLYLIE